MAADGLMRLTEAVSGVVWGPVMLAAFWGVGLRFTVLARGFQLRRFGYWMRETFGTLLSRRVRHSGESGSISQFQALATAMAATAGTGNIAGVASAIALGGPGAVFWMWLSALLGMMTSYVENALGIQYRYRGPDGRWVGGAMVYMERGLKSRFMACFFAFSCALAALGIGNMAQVNSMALVLEDAFGVPPPLCGLVTAALVGLVILGGLRRVAAVTERVVPLMVLFYTAGMVVCLVARRSAIPGALALILRCALAPRSALGGAVGYGLMQAMRMGVSRGVFSNEAGLGSSVMVHTETDVRHPRQQGLWGIFEVFVDTILMCTLTALVILTSGVYDMGAWLGALALGAPVAEGAVLTTDAVAVTLGGGGKVFMSAALTLFAFATVLGWAMYGEKALLYLTGGRGALAYRLVFTAVVVVGAVGGLGPVWAVSDMFNGLMAVPNLIAISLLGGKTAAELRRESG